MDPGQAALHHYEHEGHGTRSLSMFIEPVNNQRHVQVTEQRTSRDVANRMQWLSEETYPAASCAQAVLDNLSTHTYAALHDTFEPAQARGIA